VQPAQQPPSSRVPSWWLSQRSDVAPRRTELTIAAAGLKQSHLVGKVKGIAATLQQPGEPAALDVMNMQNLLITINDDLLELFCYPQMALCSRHDTVRELRELTDDLGKIHASQRTEKLVPEWVEHISRWADFAKHVWYAYRMLATLDKSLLKPAFDWLTTHLPNPRRNEWIAYLAVAGEAFGDIVKIHLDSQAQRRTPPVSEFVAGVAAELTGCRQLADRFRTTSAAEQLKGRVEILEDTDFIAKYCSVYEVFNDDALADGSCFLELHEVDSTGGFTTNGANRIIYIRAKGQTIGTGIHEALHLLSFRNFDTSLGVFINEGIIEYLTRCVYGLRSSLNGWAAYPLQRRVISTLIRDGALTEEQLFSFFVTDDTNRLLVAFSDHGGDDALRILLNHKGQGSVAGIFKDWCAAVSKFRRESDWTPVELPAADVLSELMEQRAPTALTWAKAVADGQSNCPIQ
jgi:hypothetical protein